jgi:hypothetical protein
MDGQSTAFTGVLLKVLVIAVGTATGILGILVAFAFGAALIGAARKGLKKLGSLVKRSKPKDSEPAPKIGP